MHRNPLNSLESAMGFLYRQKSPDFRGKIMWGKDLTLRYSVFKERFVTACAGAIMREFRMGRRSDVTMGLWKNYRGSESSAALSRNMWIRCPTGSPLS